MHVAGTPRPSRKNEVTGVYIPSFDSIFLTEFKNPERGTFPKFLNLYVHKGKARPWVYN